MWKIEAIIRPEKLLDVQLGLSRIGYSGMTVIELEGHGQQKGIHPEWPQEMRVHFLPKTKMEIVVENKDKKNVLKAILSAAWTGEQGDGKIFVYKIMDAIRIRTGEKGTKALSTRNASKIT